MKIRFLQEAQIELDEAIEFYNQELPGLGTRFLQEILNAIERVAQFPEAWYAAIRKHPKMPDKEISLRPDLFPTWR